MTDRWLRLCQQEASVLGGSCRPYKDLLALRRNNAFIPATCFFALSAIELLPRPHVTWSLKFHLPNTGQVKTRRKFAPFLPAILSIAISPRARLGREEETEMSKTTVSKLLLSSFLTIALSVAPKPAFG